MNVLYTNNGKMPLADCIKKGGSLPLVYDPQQETWYDDFVRIDRVYTTQDGKGLDGLVFQANDGSEWTARTICGAVELCSYGYLFDADLSAIYDPVDRQIVALIAAADGKGRDYAETFRTLFPQA